MTGSSAVAPYGRTWLALDTGFTHDDKVLAAGERAGWLLLAIFGRIKSQGRAGEITRAEVATLGIPTWQPRLAALLRVGLVVEVEPEHYLVPRWDGWQTAPTRAEYMRKYRARRKAERTDDGSEQQ